VKERFEGEAGRRILVDALRGQKVVSGDLAIAENIVDCAELIEVAAAAELIKQGGEDNDLYFILVGSFKIMVNGKKVAIRNSGTHVGEMTAIEPAQKRSATVIAVEKSVVLKVTEAQLTQIGQQHPNVWRSFAKELSARLLERNSMVSAARPEIRIFIMSSSEALKIAQALQASLSHEYLPVVWTNGVFQASSYPIESLEKQLENSDFAIAVAQPDDTTTSRGVEQRSPRDNVIFELGFFMGRLGRKRTVLVEPREEEIKLPSDLTGITTLTYKYGDGKDLQARLAPACTAIRDLINELGADN
jgi:predicted nucleotide-binding protein